ncbi:HypC/HybG/HupF family hydrogenase formation chaperone [Sulfobacillus thermosulfidooxidans]|uniref:HypC/HybG/HupF family hydrogenase formation chaperone n=1 Tax=Sulfobacillus thermosulfidooxidans TaxID=28034 RepID=UPI0006B63DC2|nr:HypC/HybG/HupF family hydrogenase formation chaperone [Sulfobacillus thermosulfidooxidans]
MNSSSPLFVAVPGLPIYEAHCVTCSDELQKFRVVAIDTDQWIAHVRGDNEDIWIDITFVPDLQVGDDVLCHGGTALAKVTEGNDK